MPRTFALSAVLAFRQHREDAEQRALEALAAQANQLRTSIERLDQEILALDTVRAKELKTLRTGAEHHVSFARWKMLQDARSDLRAQLATLEARRLAQQARYVVARSEREMLSELRDQQKTTWDAELQAREQKRVDDLFNSRHRGR